MRKKKILVVLTGGTICSKSDSGVMHQQSRKELALIRDFYDSDSPYADSVVIDCTDNYRIFSENMTITQWNQILKQFRENKGVISTAKAYGSYPSLVDCSPASEPYDAVVIAHGTDSLAYSAALFSLVLRDIGVPVFIVSSNKPLASAMSNGDENFKAAIACISLGIEPNVYVTYKNTMNTKVYNTCRNNNTSGMYLHLASRLTQCRNYEEDFYSVGMTDITELNKNNALELFSKLPGMHKGTERGKNYNIDMFGGLLLKNTVLKIVPYVGLNYCNYNLTEVSVILHGTYHSGTVCVEKTSNNQIYGDNSILSLIDRCREKKLYIAPSRCEGEVYDTIPIVAAHRHEDRHVRFIHGYTDEMLYIKLVIAVSMGISDIDSFIESEYNREFVLTEGETAVLTRYV